MEPPDEVMVESFLPGMRQLVAAQLRSRGLSQNRISALLGVTQASVSLYLSSNPGRAYRTLAKLSVPEGEAKRDSVALADALQKGPVEGLVTLNRIWTGLLGSGSVCAAHREKHPSLAECDFCIKEYGSRRGKVDETISEVAEAVRILEDSAEVVRVMPEVSVNIACAAGDATTPGEVVAIPGRIVKVRDRAKAMLSPEAGASAHMSKILLLVRKKRPELRACVNLRYDPGMEAALSRSRLAVVRIGTHSSHRTDDATADALEKRLRLVVPNFDAVVDQGGSGIEPNVYLFGTGAKQVARLAIRLAEDYSAA
jgi:XRE family transcriptional regulator, thiamine biosynthesis regulator